MRTRPGIADVASAAGVSISTVSVALNDAAGARVSPRTRERIRQVAQQLGYAPNGLARGLRSRRSGMIGFIGDSVATTPYAVDMILGAQETLREAGLLLLLMNTEGDPAVEAQEIATLRQQQVDGVIYAAMYHRELELPAALRGVATVVLDAEVRDAGVPWVVPDEATGAGDAARELLRHGHHRVGFVTNAEHIPASRLRRQGFAAALAEAGRALDPALVRPAPPTTEGGYHAARALLELRDRPTGLFCFSDVMAMGAYRAAAELGLRIPADVSVVGYDNMRHLAAGLFPGLTTVELPHYEMGAWAARTLLAAGPGADPEPRQVRLRGRLIRRDSVAPPPGRR
jgi:LacI family transcriptional regulator, galactose operon repressor